MSDVHPGDGAGDRREVPGGGAEPAGAARGRRDASGGVAGGGGSGTGWREVGVVVAACAAGGGLALLAAGRPWLRLTAPRRPPFTDVVLALPGRDLEPLVAALGLVGLAGVVGLLATRRWGRLAVGCVLAAAGLLVIARSLPWLAAPGAERARDLLVESGKAGGVTAGAAVTATVVPAWPLVAALGGLLLAAGGTAAALRARRWPAMSARYDKPAARAAGGPTDAALWDALDGGHDPTAPAAPPRRDPG